LRSDDASFTLRDMIHALLLAGLAFVTFWIAKKIAQRLFGKRKSERITQPAIETWVASEVARLTALKLALDESRLRASIQGTPEADVVTAVEANVARAEVVYEKPAQGLSHPELEVRLDLFFEDGSLSRSARKALWKDVPEFVRSEFERTGAAHVFRPYRFPWQHDGL
jgi:hypothetical protein